MDKHTIRNIFHKSAPDGENRAWDAATQSLREAGAQIEAFVERLRANFGVSDFPIEMTQAELEADLASGRD